jgi:hypothetical protein
MKMSIKYLQLPSRNCVAFCAEEEGDGSDACQF